MQRVDVVQIRHAFGVLKLLSLQSRALLLGGDLITNQTYLFTRHSVMHNLRLVHLSLLLCCSFSFTDVFHIAFVVG